MWALTCGNIFSRNNWRWEFILEEKGIKPFEYNAPQGIGFQNLL